MIFYHFKSKEDLYQAVLAQAASELIKLDHLQTEVDSPGQALQLLVENLLKCLAANPNLPRLFHLEAIQNQGKYYEQIGMPMFFDKLISVSLHEASYDTFSSIPKRCLWIAFPSQNDSPHSPCGE